MQKSESLLSSIEAAVNGGATVVSADSSIIIAMMQEALKIGRTATFYVSPAQAQAVMRWYRTPGRIKEWELEPVSRKERARIESELRLKAPAGFSNSIRCQCGGVYGTFEFMEQALLQHGRDFLEAILALNNVGSVLIR